MNPVGKIEFDIHMPPIAANGSESPLELSLLGLERLKEIVRQMFEQCPKLSEIAGPMDVVQMALEVEKECFNRFKVGQKEGSFSA